MLSGVIVREEGGFQSKSTVFMQHDLCIVKEVSNVSAFLLSWTYHTKDAT